MIYLKDQKITQKNVQVLTSHLSSGHDITIVTLQECKFEDNTFQLLIDSLIHNLKSKIELSLKKTKLSSPQVDVLSQAIASDFKVKKIIISLRLLTPKQFNQLFSAALKNVHIEELNSFFKHIFQLSLSELNHYKEYLQNSKKLTELSIPWNVTEEKIEICQYAFQNPNLKKLDASKPLNREVFTIFCKGMEKTTSLEELILDENYYLGLEGWEMLLKTLEGLKEDKSLHLKKLSLRYTVRMISPNTAPLVSRFLQLGLTSLNLSRNDLEKKDTNAIFEGLRNNSKLETLVLIVNKLNFQNSNFQNLFSQIKSLRTLDLTANELGDQDLIEIAKGIKLNTSIQELKLNLNKFKPASIFYFTKYISNSRSLLTLSFARNSMNDKSAKHFASMLLKNNHLRSLDLSSNAITDEGFKNIGFALSENTALERLFLDENDITEEGFEYLLEGIQTN